MKKLFLFIVGLWTWHTHCPAQLAQFHPGEVWNDTENAPINAHGGCVAVSYTHLTLPTILRV